MRVSFQRRVTSYLWNVSSYLVFSLTLIMREKKRGGEKERETGCEKGRQGEKEGSREGGRE